MIITVSDLPCFLSNGAEHLKNIEGNLFHPVVFIMFQHTRNSLICEWQAAIFSKIDWFILS